MMDQQLSINDLPVECVDEILKRITDRVDRIYARFICKLWCALIDQDCSSERYQIDLHRLDHKPVYQHAIIPDNKCYQKIDFSKIFSPFLNSQRKKTSFHFECVDFQGSEQFWRTKGNGIIMLYFDKYCTNIPLEEIVEHCSVLKTLTINLDLVDFDNTKQELNVLLENCIANRKENFSVRFLYLNGLNIVNVTAVAKLVGQVFLGVQKVFFEDTFSRNNYTNELDCANEVNSLFTSFENLKFVITLSNVRGMFMIEPSESGGAIAKMTNLSIDLDCRPITHLSAYLSRFLCGLNYLNRLELFSYKHRGHHELEDLQKFIENCPPVMSIYIFVDGNDSNNCLSSPLSKNNINKLILTNKNCLTHINKAFLQSFENLKIFQCYKLTFSDFVKLLHNLPCLEEVRFREGIVDVNPEQTISNGRLLEMRIPKIFLLETIAKYDFSNLKKLYISSKKSMLDTDDDDDDDDDSTTKFNLLSRNMDEHLKRMNCPKLEKLELCLNMKDWRINQGEFTQWMMNILALFPRLTALLFVPGPGRDDEVGIIVGKNKKNKLVVANEILKTILEKYRRLRKIGYYWDPHYLNIISPSHIEHKIYGTHGGHTLLYIP